MNYIERKLRKRNKQNLKKGEENNTFEREKASFLSERMVEKAETTFFFLFFFFLFPFLVFFFDFFGGDFFFGSC